MTSDLEQFSPEVEGAFTAFEAANENPALAEAAAKIVSGVSDESHPPPTLTDPSDGPVTLVAGFRRAKVNPEGTTFDEVTSAWVRELNGEDEEIIAKVQLNGTADDFFRVVLERGVEKLGDVRPTKDDFDALVIGDRDFLLMQIGIATYGDKIEYEKIECPHCREQFDLTITVSEEIPVKRLDRLEDQQFEVRLSKDRVARVSLPTASLSKALSEAETAPEANTILIANCVTEITGPKGTVQVMGDKQAAKRLSITDRQTLVDEMYRRMPGPDYNGVKFDHEPGCGKEVRLGVTLADLFRIL